MTFKADWGINADVASGAFNCGSLFDIYSRSFYRKEGKETHTPKVVRTDTRRNKNNPCLRKEGRGVCVMNGLSVVVVVERFNDPP